MLVLASCVLMAPLLAVLVAVACVSAAWVMLRPDARALHWRQADLDRLQRGRTCDPRSVAETERLR